jgi:hypothetical protein
LKKKEMERKQLSFVESESTAGVIEELKKLAAKENRSLNNYLGIILKNYVNEKQLTKDN